MQVKTHTGDILFPNKYKNVTFSQTQVRFVNSENDILTLPINQVIIETQNTNKELENIIDELVDIAQSNGVDVYVSNGKIINRGANHNISHHTETHIIEEDDGGDNFVTNVATGVAIGLGLGLLS
jgi:hypothetical protein